MKVGISGNPQAGFRSFVADTSDLTSLNRKQKGAFVELWFLYLAILPGIIGLLILIPLAAVSNHDLMHSYDRTIEWHRWNFVWFYLLELAIVGVPLLRNARVWSLIKQQMKHDERFALFAPFTLMGAATMAGMPAWFVPFLALGVYWFQSRQPYSKDIVAAEPWMLWKRVALMYVVYAWFYISAGSVEYDWIGGFFMFSSAEYARGANVMPSIGAVARLLVFGGLSIVMCYLSVALYTLIDVIHHNQEDGVGSVRAYLKKEIGTTAEADVRRFVHEATHVVDEVVAKRYEAEGAGWIPGIHAAVGYESKIGLKYAGVAFIGAFVLSPFASMWYIAYQFGLGSVSHKHHRQENTDMKAKMDEVIRGAGAKTESGE